MENEKFAEEILNGLESSKRAMPSEAFLKRMESMADAYINVVERFSKRTILGIAASLLILISANIYVVANCSSAKENTSVASVNSGYDLMPAKSIYYE